jgi:hypothetical protein
MDKYIIVKSGRMYKGRKHGYAGPSCYDAHVPPGMLYYDRSLATIHALWLTNVNPVGFEVVLYPEVIKCTAWDLVGKHSDKIDTTHLIKVGANGRVLYAFAGTVQGSDNVKLQRFVPGTLIVNTRYIDPDTTVCLIPLEE